MPAVKTVFMFSGQGSQYFQMGRELFKTNDIFHDWMIRLDTIAKGLTGDSVIGTLYSDASRKGDSFDRTLLTHPAIFMVEYALAQALIHAGVLPDMVLGASMGSFAAATVAGFIEVEDALASVVHQAIAIEECERGGMIAVLADPALFAEDFLSHRSELAAVNFFFAFRYIRKIERSRGDRGCLKKRQCGLSAASGLLSFSFAVDRQGQSSIRIFHGVDTVQAGPFVTGMLRSGNRSE